MANVDGEPLDKDGSPFAVGVLALLVIALSVIIYEMRGTWPAERGGFVVAFFGLLGVALIAISRRVE